MKSRCIAAALAACACVSPPGAAQGFFPGAPPPADARLPYGIEPIANVRTYFFDSDNGTSQSEAWALGGYAGLRSPWLADVLQLAVVGYTSQPLYAPASKPGSKLLLPDQDAINVLGEAFVSLRVLGQTITGYRQLLDRPFLNPDDSRMVPNTFEAYTLLGRVADVDYIGGYATKVKVRDADSFQWMSNAAGGSGTQRGTAFAGATWTFREDGFLRVDNQYTFDVFNTFYIEGHYPIRYRDVEFGVGAQYYPQRSVGEAQIGDFSTFGAGVQGTLRWKGLAMSLAYTQTGKDFETQAPYGSHPSYLHLQQVDFNQRGEKAVALTASNDFSAEVAAVLSEAAAFGTGWDALSNKHGTPVPDQHETDVRLDYALPKSSLLRNLVLTFRYSWLSQSGSPTATELRAYANYLVPF